MTSQHQQPIYATCPADISADLFADVVSAAVSPSELPSVTPQQARNFVDVPQAFATIAGQLDLPALAKLKTLDTSTAMVALSTKGAKAGPEPLGFLMAGDFAENCAEELGCGGKIRVTITHKVNGKSENLYFSMRVAGDSLPKQTESDKMLAVFREMQAESDKKLEALRMDMLLSGGGKQESLADKLGELKVLAGVMRDLNPAPAPQAAQTDLTAQMTGMVNVFKGVAEVQNELKAAAGAIAPIAEKSITEQANEFVESPLGSDVRDAVKFMIKKKMDKGSSAGSSERLAKGPIEPTEDLWGAA